MAKPAEIREIFEAVIELSTGDELEQYLDAACGDDVELRAEVESLIRSHDSSGRFLGGNVASAIDEEQRPIPQQVGRYRIREQIGEGGMGVVYVAEQTEPVQRKVALKIIKPGMDTKEVIARFEAERQALAFMEHPNIARVLDAGATESGRSYFVMELVRGIPITEYCDQVKAAPRERLELFQTVCDAVQHAHQKGIIHRDIKPSNVLVTQVSAKPVVKVIDFGLAKAVSGQRLTEKTLYTGFMKLMGTPAYMSPEQAGLSGLDIDTRSDVYSLGVLLYELLTGTTPLDKTEIKHQAYDELCRQVREVDAPKPSTRFSTLKDADRSTVAQQRQIEPRDLRLLLHGDLDSVVLKAIEKDRDRRYGSPQDLSADIERFLEDKPVVAVPPSQWYLARKYMRRHRVVITAATAILILLVSTTAFSTWQAIRATAASRVAREKTKAAVLSEQRAVNARNEADKAREDAVASERQTKTSKEQQRRMLYAANMQLADQYWKNENGTPTDIQSLLVAWIPTDGKPDLRDFVWRYQWTRLHFAAEQTAVAVRATAISPSGNLIVADQHSIREWDDSSKTYVDIWTNGTSEKAPRVVLSSCGRWAALSNESGVRLIDLGDGKMRGEYPGTRARFARGGNFLLTWDSQPDVRDHSFEIWDLNQQTSWKLEDAGYQRKWIDYVDSISPDGQHVVIAKDQFRLDVYRINGQRRRWSWNAGVEGIAWSPNGSIVASGHFGGDLLIRRVVDSEDFLRVKTGRSGLRALAFSHDSRKLAVGSEDGTIDFYDMSQFVDTAELTEAKNFAVESLPAPKRVRTLKVHVSRVDSIIFATDDQSIATRGADGTAKLLRLDEKSDVLDAPTSFPMGGRVGLELEDSEDGVRVSHVDEERLQLEHGDIHEGDRVASIIENSIEHELSSKTDAVDARRLLRGPTGSNVRLKIVSDDTSEEQSLEVRRTEGKWPIAFRALAFVNDSSNLFVASTGGAFRLTRGGRVLADYPFHGVTSVRESPNGALTAFDDYKELVLLDLKADEVYARLDSSIETFPTPKNGYGGSLAFSPDGRYIAMGTGNRFTIGTSGLKSEIKVWEVATKKPLRAPVFQHSACISGVVFSPDSQTLYATDRWGTIRSWDTSTWNERQGTMKGLGRVVALDVSPDGKWIAQGGFDGLVIFDLMTHQKRHVLEGKIVTNVKFAPRRATLVVTRVDGQVVFLDAVSGMELASLNTGNAITDASFSPDGNSLAILGQNGTVTMFDALDLNAIDRHPATTAALGRRRKAHASLEQDELATETQAPKKTPP